MSAALLARTLTDMGITCTVETDGAMAVIMPGALPVPLRDPGVRARVLEAARACGFTHVAVEVMEGGAADAPAV